MDQRDFILFLREVDLQCRYAWNAYTQLWSSVQILHHDAAFYFVHSFLSHSALVSKLLWPVPTGSADRKRRMRERGEALRGFLHLTDGGLLANRSLRNSLEHYDERLQDWVAETQTGVIAEANFSSPAGMGGMERIAYHRNLDIETGDFTFQGEAYNLHGVMKELQAILDLTQPWLNEHDPVTRVLNESRAR